MHPQRPDRTRDLPGQPPDTPTPRAPAFTVFGRVADPDGPPVAGVEVEALHRNLRSTLPLGRGHTDQRGLYAIGYDPPDGLANADLFVRASTVDPPREIGRSALFCHASRVVRADVVAGGGGPYRGYSELERLTHALEPHLDGVPLGALTEADVDFLACAARQDASLIATVAVAHRDEQRTGVGAAAFYGLLREGMPRSLPALLSQPSRVQRGALERAIAANVVPAALAPDVDDILRALKQAAVAVALEVPEAQLATSLPGLLGTTGLSGETQTALLTRYALHQGPMSEYWSALKEEDGVGPQQVAELQLTLQLGTLAGGYVPMVELLQEKAGAQEIASVQDLATLSQQDWLALVERSGVPPTVPGETAPERAHAYASALRSTIERAFPTPTIVAGLRRRRAEDEAELLAFFDNSPDFAFTANVDRYLKQHGDAAVEGIADVPALTRRLKDMQRRYRLAPDVGRLQAMDALAASGVSSAQDVVRLGRSAFARSVAPALATSTADAIFAGAQQTAAVALTLFGQYGHPLVGATPAVMGTATVPTTSDTIPSWETLFGPFSSCACEHCRSVCGPAAYLVDLFAFVRRQPATGGTALDVLFERRPDLGEIELSCANSDTELPYVDLVKEILEAAVARQPAVHQTSWTADELRANEEHLNETAYRRLAGQVHPRALPFNLWLSEARTYLGHLGVTFDELTDVLLRRGLSGSDQPALEQAIAVEQLKLSPESAQIVMGTLTPARGPEDFWGVDAADWPAALFDLPTFLRQAELSYAELTDLLSARFIDPAGVVTVRFATGCATEDARILNLGEPALDRMHRFLRLQRAVGWTTLELDAAVTAMAAPDLTPELLVAVARIRRLGEQLGTPVIESLSWWSAVSTAASGDDVSLYDELFLNNAVLSPLDDAFTLNADRSDLLTAGAETIDGHIPAILAALAVTDDELSLVLEHAALTRDAGLTLDSLSALHRVVSLARALDLSIADFLSVCALTGIDPWLSPRTTLDLVTAARAIDESPFSIAELDHLLRHVYDETSGLAPTDSAIALVLDGIGAALAVVATENAFVADPTGAFTQSRLALLLGPDDVETAMAVLAGTSTAPRAEQGAFLEEHLSAVLDVADAKDQLLGPSALADPQARYEYVLAPLLSHLVTTLSTERAVQLLADSLGLETAVTEALLTRHVQTPTTSPRPLIEPFLELAPAVEYGAEVLDSYRLLHKIAAVLVRLEATAEELPWLFEEGPRLGWLDLTRLPLTAVVDDALIARAFEGWRRLVALYGLRDRYAAGDATIFAVLDLVRVGEPREAALGELATVTGWSYEDLDFLTGADGFALGFPGQYRDERWLVRLEAAVQLLQRLGLSAAQVAAWRVSGDLAEMREVARGIKTTVKAKYDNDAWLLIAAPLKDALREEQRSALVAFLIATHDDVADADDLYARYLIDVQMGACATTSRIQQAHGSVQLFVQRCLMNLEPEVDLSEAAADEWRWMKLYRVWEANRRVFLYPESFTVPELRDDKSPFFEELETELLQSEATSAAAETALVNYMLKLGAVANLDVRAVVHEQDSDAAAPRDVLHVVARTPNTPHEYYYRTLVDARAWTPWQRVDVDVQGDLLLAVVWNGRLHLMWPVFRELGRADDPCEMTLLERLAEEFPEPAADTDYWPVFTWWMEDTQQPLMEGIVASDNPDLEAAIDEIKGALVLFFGDTESAYAAVDQIVTDWAACEAGTVADALAWEVQLAWSEYRDGGWTPKQAPDAVLRTTFHPQRRFLLKPRIASSGFLERAGDVGGEIAGDVGGVIVPALPTAQLAVQPAAGGGELMVTCSAGESVLGTFRFTGCGGQVIVTAETDGSTTVPHVFDESVSVDHMRLEEDPNADFPLTLACSDVDADGDWLASSPLRYVTALGRTPGSFNLAVPHQYSQFVSQDDFFFQDETRSFHVSPVLERLDARLQALLDAETVSFDLAVQPSWTAASHTTAATVESNGHRAVARMSIEADASVVIGQTIDLAPGQDYRFYNFHHPHACTLLKTLGAEGVAGIMQRDTQAMSSEYFVSTYAPEASIAPPPYPLRNVEFDHGGAFTDYNWEGFFHAPLLIATRLSANQRFEEAQRWFHYIFNPTARADRADVTGPERYWVFQPFYLESVPQDLPALMAALSEGDAALEDQVAQWRAEPFSPHLIARLRPGAYQKSVVMAYLDNLIAWGDMLFAQDTLESLNEATQLYVLAADILGPRPEPLPAQEVEQPETYNSLAERLDEFSNALVEIENVLAAPSGSAGPARGPIDVGPIVGPLDIPEIHLPPLPTPELLYFCIPDNDDLLSYWGIVADRLFKLRNCMNIEGVVRQLPLYQPPIDPALLVQAVAAGVDLSSALSDLYAPRPAYRFQVMLQRAVEFCADVRSLGGALLSALERQDGEELELLRATHETQTLDDLRAIREGQVEEAERALEALERSRAMVEGRRQYYATLVADDLSSYEQTQVKLLEDANRINRNASREEQAATILYALPQIVVSVPPKTEYGGINFGAAAQAIARWHGTTGAVKSHEADNAALLGGHARRAQEWRFQLDSAERELAQLDMQLAAAAVRLAVVENELGAHDAQTSRATAVRDVMTGKYTTQELYGWTSSQISALYSQSYQLAYDLAKRAERAYEHELGVEGAGFINFGYWDSLKKGLLSGERLHNDLRRMDAAYLEADAREHEMTKHVSLSMIDPVALVKLRREGVCHVHLPEALFDLDCPGEYMRRLKTVGLSIPSVAGPYTGINCKLSLESSSVRVGTAAGNTATGAGYLRAEPFDADDRFRDEVGVSESIVASLGQGDHGLFELNLGDQRYLPFERRGVISTWRLELTAALPAFDYESISDVVFTLRYTARDGGGALRTACLDAMTDALRDMTTGSGAIGLVQSFSVRHEFGDAWYRFVNPPAGAETQTLELPLDETYFPYQFAGSGVRINSLSLYLLPKQGADEVPTSVGVEVSLGGGAGVGGTLSTATKPTDSYAYRPYLSAEGIAVAGSPDVVTITTAEALTEETVDNLILVFGYEMS